MLWVYDVLNYSIDFATAVIRGMLVSYRSSFDLSSLGPAQAFSGSYRSYVIGYCKVCGQQHHCYKHQQYIVHKFPARNIETLECHTRHRRVRRDKNYTAVFGWKVIREFVSCSLWSVLIRPMFEKSKFCEQMSKFGLYNWRLNLAMEKCIGRRQSRLIIIKLLCHKWLITLLGHCCWT